VPEPLLRPASRPPRAVLDQRVSTGGPPLELSKIMRSAGEVGFAWDIGRDALAWDGHAVALLGVTAPADIATGAAFQLKITPEGLTERAAALVRAAAGSSGEASYRVSYAFQPNGRSAATRIILEELGICTVGPTGTPTQVRGVIRVITQRHEQEERLRFRADHDVLTGQLNRSALIDALGIALVRSSEQRQPFAFLLASVNGLNVINETFGFDTGDELLAGTAQVLRQHLRTGDSLGRYSSNKFGLIVNNCGPGVMRVVADRLMTSIRGSIITTAASRLPTTISIGGVSLPDGGATVPDALAHALQALDGARTKRLDSFVAYEPKGEHQSVKSRNTALANSLISALDENRLTLLLQSMVCAKTGTAAHYECLLRMTTLDGTLISAGEFMPIAEQLGLSRLIDLRTLELAVGMLVRYPRAHLSLNVSGLTSGDNEWLVALHRLTGGNRALTERLTIEITETAAIHDLDQSMIFVDTIKDLGCKAAIDDFGVGYTNFRNLKLLNADLVKIDGAFIKNVCHDKGDQVFVKSMVELARAFGMKTVAEWVGDAETAKFLTEAGIDYLQGYHFGVPTAPELLLGPQAH
jgi:diguanylate cyclase (GGDEF)-like protein